ncbi:unnamed protein product [Effrenium voratum]|uniref:Uncharacterized protein n=1 Tax=Effrenium voratum TaxID=2562239 RepID=A0AA36HXB9_9DINO|nr:unnamed protein product [Effrenium voratum]
MVEQRIDRWFEYACVALADQGWHMEIETREGSCSHRECPWGGHLLRFDYKHVPVSGSPGSCLQIRPEARHLERVEDSELCPEELLLHVGPGDVVLRGSCKKGSFALGRATSGGRSGVDSAMGRFVALFGNLGGPFLQNFCETEEPLTVRHQLRRNFPKQGDATAVSHTLHSKPQGAMRVSQGDGPGTFRLCLVYNAPVCVSAHWVQECLEQMVKFGRQHVVWLFNHPSMLRLRNIDTDLYVVLGLRHFARGSPLLPHVGSAEPDVIISTDAAAWTIFRFDAENTKFQAARYMQQFLERLGYHVRTFDTLDGQKLVPYQCAMRRDEWLRLRGEFLVAFRCQRAAYRRAYGGSQAPDLKEDMVAHFQRTPWGRTCVEHFEPQLVVRRTFLHVEEGDDDLQIRKIKSIK